MSASFMVPKHSVNVELRQDGAGARPAEVYLRDSAAPERGERLGDVLSSRKFLPCRSDGRLEMVSTRHIFWLRIDLLEGIDELDPEAEGAEGSVGVGVKLMLEDGSRLSGGLRWFLPPAARRVSDYLEQLPPFFPVRSRDSLYLVNRERVVSVTPIDEVMP